MFHRTFAPLSALGLLALTLATTGCSHGNSPTEPAFSDLGSSTAAVSSTGDKKHGADDPAGDHRGGRQRPARGAEFSGAVSAVSGQTLSLASGARVVVNGQTQWNARGDLKSLDQVAAAVAAGQRTRVEGRGARQADGSLLAQSIKAETGR